MLTRVFSIAPGAATKAKLVISYQVRNVLNANKAVCSTAEQPKYLKDLVRVQAGFADGW